MKMKDAFWLLLVLSCAPEQSAEVRRREDVDRTFERLRPAVGVYNGYFENSESTITPLSIEVQIIKNPTTMGQKPILAVSLRTGLFGGVTIAATSTAFDFGKKELVASFGRHGNPSGSGSGGGGGGSASGGAGGGSANGSGSGPGSAPNPGVTDGSGSTSPGLELRGIMREGKFTEATLVGSHIGNRNVVLEKDGMDLFDSNTEHAYEVIWKSTKTSPGFKSAMKIKTLSVTQPSPKASDLPYLSALEVSMEFDPFAVTPQHGWTALYDPTTATLDVQFAKFSWIRLSGLSLSLQTHELAPLAGDLNLGGVSIRGLSLKPVLKIPTFSTFPPPTFLGTYQGSPKARAYKAVAYLSFLGGTDTNKEDLPFPVFPKMRIELDICNGGEVMNQKVLRLQDLDYLGGKAVFHRLTTEHDPLEIVFERDWSRVEGVFLQNPAHEGGRQPKVVLRPNAEVGEKGCGATAKAP